MHDGCLVAFIVMPFSDRLGKRSAFVAMRGSQILPLGLKLSYALRAELFFMLSSLGFFFRLQKACVRFTFLETYLQFKPFDAWRYRIEHSDVASWRLPRPNEPCDDCHPPRSIHASWRLKMWRASLLLWRPKWLFRPMHKIAWWSKWKYEGFQGDLWPWFYVNI